MSATLHDYTDVEPIIARKIRPVYFPGDPKKVVGFIGPSNRDANAVVCQRKREAYLNDDGKMEQQYYRKGGGYALSESSIERLRSVGVSLVIIHEVDNDRVLEHDLADFEQGDSINEIDDDPQKYVPTEQAIHTWTAREATLIHE